MEKKQGFFASLKDEVVRGLSPARSRAKSPARNPSPMAGLLLPRRRKNGNGRHQSLAHLPEPLIARSGSFRPVGEALAPLVEGPDPDAVADGGGESRREGGWGHWVRGQLSRTPSVSSGAGGGGASSSSYHRRSDLRLLLGVMGAPLAPVHVSSADPLPHLSIKDTPIVSSFYLLNFYIFSSFSALRIHING